MAFSPMLSVRCFPEQPDFPQMRFVHEKIEISATASSRRLQKPLLQPYYEILFFVRGKREVTVGDQTFVCIPGDILFFNPEEPHFGFNEVSESYDWFHLYVYPNALAPFAEHDTLMRCFTDRPYCRENRLSLPEPARSEIFQLFCRAEQAYAKSELLCGTYLLQVLLRLSELLPEHREHGESTRPELLQRILHTISTSQEKLPSVSDLTQQFSISRSGLWRLFRSCLHVSPQQYLQLRRLAFAKQLLQNGSSVTDACMRSGFGECSRFIAHFRASYGLTPLQYQKQNHIR